MKLYTKTVPERHHAIGYALYMGGHPLSTCQNDHQVRGWWAAEEGHLAATMAYADAETATYLSNPYRGTAQVR